MPPTWVRYALQSRPPPITRNLSILALDGCFCSAAKACFRAYMRSGSTDRAHGYFAAVQ
jgi:hypothetical protein